MEISIIIPVFNREKLIIRALDSVMAQTHKHLHIIVIDNNSTDGTLAAVEQYADSHRTDETRFTIASQPIPGAAAARHKGSELADTEWIMFFDSDDTMLPDLVERYVNAINSEDDQLMLVCTGATVQQPDGKLIEKPIFDRNPIENHIFHSFLATQRMIVRKSYLEQCGNWNHDAKIWNDWELGLRLLLPHPSTLVMGGKSSVVIHPQTESITGTDYSSRAESILATIDIAEAAVNRFFDENPERTFKPSRERILRLLDYKRMALAGLCEHEHKGSGTALRDKVLAKYAKASSTRRFIYSLIFDHTATGLRGSYIWAHFL